MYDTAQLFDHLAAKKCCPTTPNKCVDTASTVLSLTLLSFLPPLNVEK